MPTKRCVKTKTSRNIIICHNRKKLIFRVYEDENVDLPAPLHPAIIIESGI
jgi:hypothetical protein